MKEIKEKSRFHCIDVNPDHCMKCTSLSRFPEYVWHINPLLGNIKTKKKYFQILKVELVPEMS